MKLPVLSWSAAAASVERYGIARAQPEVLERAW